MGVLDRILTELELVTEIVGIVPNPAQPFAAIALKLEKITHAAIRAHAASSGKTVDEIIAGLRPIELIP